MANKISTNEPTEVKSKSKIIIIILLAIIVALSGVIAYIVISDNQISDIMQEFMAKEEYTILLDEFVVNLKTNNRVQHFLKVKIALMYNDKKESKVIEASVSKIRDVILTDLREKTYEDIINGEKTIDIKTELLEKINTALNSDVIKDLYITDLIVQ